MTKPYYTAPDSVMTECDAKTLCASESVTAPGFGYIEIEDGFTAED